MYCDKDSRGLYCIMELTVDEFETIRRALLAFRTGLISHRLPEGTKHKPEPHIQYERASAILKQTKSI